MDLNDRVQRLINDETTFHGASVEAADAIDSVKPPMAIWQAWYAPITGGRRAYKVAAYGITSGAICGGTNGNLVATAIFDDRGDPVLADEIRRLETENNGYSAFGWRQTQEYQTMRDLLRALATQ